MLTIQERNSEILAVVSRITFIQGNLEWKFLIVNVLCLNSEDLLI